MEDESPRARPPEAGDAHHRQPGQLRDRESGFLEALLQEKQRLSITASVTYKEGLMESRSMRASDSDDEAPIHYPLL